jgi:TonB family protein
VILDFVFRRPARAVSARARGGWQGLAVFKILGRYFRDLAAPPKPALLFILAAYWDIEKFQPIDCVLDTRPSRWLSGQRASVPACCLFLFCLFLLPPSPSAYAQKAENNLSSRKLIAQVDADYPPDLKRAYIGGVVRLDIVVNPHGSVDSVHIAGGNPILAECAARAVKHWKYTPAASSSNIRVNLHFDPSR